jgi:biofilm PGA synthesis N-glycosyltransferase PgaC
MQILLEYIFWISISLISYTWIGYFLLLNFIAVFTRNKVKIKNENNLYPFISVIVAAYNEEKVVEKRIRNLLNLDYPKDKIEIIIASDGSTDQTVVIAKRYEKQGVMVLDFKENRGRADVHNDSVKIANGKIVVFTDADSSFEKDFVKKIVLSFSDPEVGCVVGNLIYKSKGSCIAERESFYYNSVESKLKDLENKIGILANGTGACMAIRKGLFKPLTPVDDVDTATVVDIVLQGYRAVFAKDAIAYDLPPNSVKSELSYRIRGTSKTIMSLLRRTGLKGWFKNPILSWSILSHRVFRYFTPYFIAVTLILNLFLLGKSILYQIFFFLQIVFYLLVTIGWIGEYAKKRIPVASTAFSFGLAMFGMMLGVAKGITGKAPASYKMPD